MIDKAFYTLGKAKALFRSFGLAHVNMTSEISCAVIALGSNMGESADTLQKAVNAINALDEVSVIKASSMYRTKPVGYADQDDFTNAVLIARTTLSPAHLYDKLAALELEFGRVRLFKNGPRTLDLDVIVCDEILSDDEHILLPHPRAQERAFVLLPLNEIAPDLIFPDTGNTVSAALKLLDPSDLDGISKLGPLVVPTSECI